MEGALCGEFGGDVERREDRDVRINGGYGYWWARSACVHVCWVGSGRRKWLRGLSVVGFEGMMERKEVSRIHVYLVGSLGDDSEQGRLELPRLTPFGVQRSQ